MSATKHDFAKQCDNGTVQDQCFHFAPPKPKTFDVKIFRIADFKVHNSESENSEDSELYEQLAGTLVDPKSWMLIGESPFVMSKSLCFAPFLYVFVAPLYNPQSKAHRQTD